MRLIIQKNAEDVGIWAARYIKKRIVDFNPTADKPFVLGLPTGSSPLSTYVCLLLLGCLGNLASTLATKLLRQLFG